MKRLSVVAKEVLALKKLGRKVKKIYKRSNKVTKGNVSDLEKEFLKEIKRFYWKEEIDVEILKNRYRKILFQRRTFSDIILNYGLGLATGMTVLFLSEYCAWGRVFETAAVFIIAMLLVCAFRLLPEIYFVHSIEVKTADIEYEVLKDILKYKYGIEVA